MTYIDQPESGTKFIAPRAGVIQAQGKTFCDFQKHCNISNKHLRAESISSYFEYYKQNEVMHVAICCPILPPWNCPFSMKTSSGERIF